MLEEIHTDGKEWVQAKRKGGRDGFRDTFIVTGRVGGEIRTPAITATQQEILLPSKRESCAEGVPSAGNLIKTLRCCSPAYCPAVRLLGLFLALRRLAVRIKPYQAGARASMQTPSLPFGFPGRLTSHRDGFL